MAKQTVNIGTSANKGNGDPLRTAFTKINNNFDELYSALGSDGDLFDPSSVDQSLVPTTTNTVDLGSASKQWRSLYVSNNTIYIGGVAIGVDANGALTTGGTVVGSTPAWANITGKPTFAAVATSGAYADLTGKPTDLKGSVFADDSTLMIDAVDNKIYATELTAAVGNFVNVNSNNVDVENINGLSQQIHLSVGGNTNLIIENNLVTIQNVSLAVAGDITLGGNIRSEDAINIEINLSDSTLRRWRFGEDGVLDLAGNLQFTNGTVQTTAYQKVASLADQAEEVTFGVIGVRIIDSAGCYVQIRATSSLTAHYNLVVDGDAAGTGNGSLSLTTSFVNFPNIALNAIGSKVDALLKIDSLGVAYRIQILTGSGSSPWNNNLVVIEQVL